MEKNKPLLQYIWFHLAPGHRQRPVHPPCLPAFARDAVDILATFNISIDGEPHIQVSWTRAHAISWQSTLPLPPSPPQKKKSKEIKAETMMIQHQSVFCCRQNPVKI